MELDGYAELERIGKGGFSTVFRARQVRLDRYVAIKVLTTDLGDPAEVRRFENEARVLGQLSQHPHVVDVFDAGISDEGQPYIVMRLCPGGSYGDAVRRHGVLAPGEVARIGQELAGALQAAHDLGVVHRDIKPENVLMDAAGEPVLSDFGIAAIVDPAGRMTTSEAFSPAHAAPEVLDRNAYSPASDQYSLASTLYTLLAGAPAFRGDTAARHLLAVLYDPVPPLTRSDVPPYLRDALVRAMAKDPAQRFPSARSFGDALRGMVDSVPGMPAAAEAPTPWVESPNTTVLRPRRSPVTGPPTLTQPVTDGDRRSRRGPAVLVGLALIASLGAGVAVALTMSPEESGAAPSQEVSRTPSAPAPRSEPPADPTANEDLPVSVVTPDDKQQPEQSAAETSPPEPLATPRDRVAAGDRCFDYPYTNWKSVMAGGEMVSCESSHTLEMAASFELPESASSWAAVAASRRRALEEQCVAQVDRYVGYGSSAQAVARHRFAAYVWFPDPGSGDAPARCLVAGYEKSDGRTGFTAQSGSVRNFVQSEAPLEWALCGVPGAGISTIHEGRCEDAGDWHVLVSQEVKGDEPWPGESIAGALALEHCSGVPSVQVVFPQTSRQWGQVGWGARCWVPVVNWSPA